MNKLRFQTANVLKFGAVALCVAFALRGHPPASAQSAEDARQDDAIANLRESTDKAETKVEQRLDMIDLELRNQHDDLNDVKNENREEFGGIGILYGGGALLGLRRKREAA